MKIRNGFVSNSSSSSFVLVVKKEHHDKVMAEVHPYVQACVKAIGFSESKFNGTEVISLGWLSVMDYDPWEDISIDYEGDIPDGDYDEGMYGSEAIDAYADKVKELFGKDAVFIERLDG